MVTDYEIHDSTVVLILCDSTRIVIRPDCLSGGISAYKKLLFLLHRMHVNETAYNLVNNLATKLLK